MIKSYLIILELDATRRAVFIGHACEIEFIPSMNFSFLIQATETSETWIITFSRIYCNIISRLFLWSFQQGSLCLHILSHHLSSFTFTYVLILIINKNDFVFTNAQITDELTQSWCKNN